MTRPLDDDTGTPTAGPARAKREYLHRDAYMLAVEDGGRVLRVTYWDREETRWEREGTTEWYRRTA